MGDSGQFTLPKVWRQNSLQTPVFVNCLRCKQGQVGVDIYPERRSDWLSDPSLRQLVKPSWSEDILLSEWSACWSSGDPCFWQKVWSVECEGIFVVPAAASSDSCWPGWLITPEESCNMKCELELESQSSLHTGTRLATTISSQYSSPSNWQRRPLHLQGPCILSIIDCRLLWSPVCHKLSFIWNILTDNYSSYLLKNRNGMCMVYFEIRERFYQ